MNTASATQQWPTFTAEFDRLVARAQACRCCPRMEGRRRVLGPANGSLGSRVLFVAEAPGRLGADRSGTPLTGDQSGRNFDRLLAASGLSRSEVFITNAVLCNPRDRHGRNAAPTETELRSCVHFLKATIEIVDPHIVVSLGAVALRALDRIEPHGLVLSRHVAVAVEWSQRHLMPLYHPSPRAQLHRTFTDQLSDFDTLGELVSTLGELHPSSQNWAREDGV